MIKIFIFTVASVIILYVAIGYLKVALLPSEPKFNTILSQLNGNDCYYYYNSTRETILKRKSIDITRRRHDDEKCIIDAVDILVTMKNSHDVVPPLIDALEEFRNIDTGDGMIPIRSSIALALGEIGDQRAIDPLRSILETNDETQILKSTSGRSIPESQTSFEAVNYAIQKIISAESQ